MTCERVQTPQGVAIVCSPGRSKRCACGARAPLLCDWKVPKRRSGTCDTPICARCATSPAPGKDLCPEHAAAFENWKAAHPAATPIACSRREPVDGPSPDAAGEGPVLQHPENVHDA